MKIDIFQTVVFCALEKSLEEQTGLYYKVGFHRIQMENNFKCICNKLPKLRRCVSQVHFENTFWKNIVWKNNVGHSFQKMYVSRSVVYERSVMIQRHRQKIEKKILSLISGIDVQDRF